jgi:hypothetical protein
VNALTSHIASTQDGLLLGKVEEPISADLST